MLTPVRTSPLDSLLSSSTLPIASMYAVPPPEITPSSTAALVADRASSILNFFSFISVSVAAPTLITATPPANFAKRSWSFSRSKSDVSSSICLRITWTRSAISALSPPPSTIVVVSFVIITLPARPKSSTVTSSSSMPKSSAINVPPVKIAISCKFSLRRSPKPGALTATQLQVPRNLLRIKVERASPSTSSAMITNFWPVLTTSSSKVKISWMAEIFLSVIKIWASS